MYSMINTYKYQWVKSQRNAFGKWLP